VTLLATLVRHSGHVFAHCFEDCGWSSQPHDDETAAAAELTRHVTKHDVKRNRRSTSPQDYVCSQCGPDSRGADVHAETMHTWPSSRVSERA
jgi:hypothetical protein